MNWENLMKELWTAFKYSFYILCVNIFVICKLFFRKIKLYYYSRLNLPSVLKFFGLNLPVAPIFTKLFRTRFTTLGGPVIGEWGHLLQMKNLNYPDPYFFLKKGSLRLNSWIYPYLLWQTLF